MAARMFFGHGQFCSLSTMPLTAFSNDGHKLVCTACTAVPIIMGVVVGSSLVATTAMGGTTVHGVHLLPFIQLWRCEMTTLCTLFDVPVSHSENIRMEGIDFSTWGLSLVNPSSNTNMCEYICCRIYPTFTHALRSLATPCQIACAGQDGDIFR